MTKIKMLLAYTAAAALLLLSASADNRPSVSVPTNRLFFSFYFFYFFNSISCYFTVTNAYSFRQDDVTVESAVPYFSPSAAPQVGVFLAEHFDDPSTLAKQWIKSNSKKPDVEEELAQYDGQ